MKPAGLNTIDALANLLCLGLLMFAPTRRRLLMYLLFGWISIQFFWVAIRPRSAGWAVRA